MEFIRKVVLFTAQGLTEIGNFVIFLLTSILSFSKKIIKKSKHRKKGKQVTIFPLPISIKLKYFFLGTLFSFIFFFIPIIIVVTLQTLPNPSQLSSNLAPQTTKIYDRNGVLLYQMYANQNRTIVPLSDVPKYLQDATIAIEDKNFYKNPGFDIQAILRAAISDISGQGFQGGSTITQQLIKSSLLTPQQTIERKIQEVILAFWAEKIYTKNQILTMYFNQVPYGGTAWGVEAAAQTYFGKNVKDLDLAQCAFLAGMPQAPTTYSPFGSNPNLWKKRQEEVLSRMQQLRYITKDQQEQANAEKLTFVEEQTPFFAPHFVWYIKDLLVKKYGLPLVEKGGLQVITSLDLKTQQIAQNVVSQEVNKDAYLNLTNGAALITNPTNGDILAMVGSSDYNNPVDGKFNVTTALRQPGSTIKLVTYAAALSHGFTAATILDDSPVSFPSYPGGPLYTPVNYDGKFHGRVPLRIALGNSFNIPAVKTLQAIGVDTFIDYGKRMGLSHLGNAKEYGLSATLGAVNTTMIDMATAYGTVANSGNRIDLNPILKITDGQGNILEQKQPTEGVNVLDKGVAFILSNILADNNARLWEFGPNSPLVIPGHTVSVKTGTTDDKRDNWTIGYTSTGNRLVAVWVGNNNNSPMSQVLASGITGAAPIWHGIMANLLADKQDHKPKIPDDIVIKTCGSTSEYFLKGTDQGVSCGWLPTTGTPSPTPQ